MERNKLGQFVKGHKPYKPWLGKQFSEKHTKKRIESRHKNRLSWNSEETKRKIRKAMKGKIGEKSNAWKGKNCKKKQKRNDPLYHNWVKRVKRRDKNICQLKDENCFGYNIVHHIKGWEQYPELRYEINNGITLCQAHHPRTRAKEKRLIPLFEKLVKKEKLA